MILNVKICYTYFTELCDKALNDEKTLTVTCIGARTTAFPFFPTADAKVLFRECRQNV